MDVIAFIFVGLLLVIGLALIAAVRASLRQDLGQPAEEEDARALRQRELRMERQMQRRRWRVWHKVDELHALFIERTAEEQAGRLLQAASTPPAGEGELTVLGGVEFTVPDLQTTYELFLREDFLKPAGASRRDNLDLSA